MINKFWNWFYTKAREKNYDFYIFLIGFAVPFSLLFIENLPQWLRIIIGMYSLVIFSSNVFFKLTYKKQDISTEEGK